MLPSMEIINPPSFEMEPNSMSISNITITNTGNARSLLQFSGNVSEEDYDTGWSISYPHALYINGTKIKPKWSGNKSKVHPIKTGLVEHVYKVKKIKCRNLVSIVEQPTKANNYTCVVFIHDAAMWASWYQFELR